MSGGDRTISGDKTQRVEASGTYADIIEHKHYEPKNHPRMSSEARAAQFSPFAALSGYGEMVKDVEEAEPAGDMEYVADDSIEYAMDDLPKSVADEGADGIMVA